MKVVKAIRTLLTADTNVAATVAARIYPIEIPQNAALPAVTIRVIGNRPGDSKSGASSVDSLRIQVDSYSASYSEASDLDAYIRAALDHYGGSVTESVNIQNTRYENTIGFRHWERDIYQVSSDYQVRVIQAVEELENPDLTIVGEYASDEDAIADGNANGDIYVLSSDNIYGYVRGVAKMIGTTGALYFASDDNAILGGSMSGDTYYLSLDNLYGQVFGAAKRLGLAGAASYESDTAAVAGGRSVGQLYYVNANNIYGLTIGQVKRIYA